MNDNNVKLPCFRNWSLKKLLIWASVVAYLSGLIVGIIAWLFYCQIDNTYDWNWEIVYGPLITVLSYWMLGGMVVLYLWARERGKLRKRK